MVVLLHSTAAGEHQETDCRRRRTGLRTVLQNLVEDPPEPVELVGGQEPLALLLAETLDAQTGGRSRRIASSSSLARLDILESTPSVRLA